MNNEPVAWMWQDDDEKWVEVMPRKSIPFYTHPVKELTDEEIEEVEKLCKQPLASWAWQVEFARAILRKAQEK